MNLEDAYDYLAAARRPLTAAELARLAPRGGLSRAAVPAVQRLLRRLARLGMAAPVGDGFAAVPSQRRQDAGPGEVRYVKGVPHPPLAWPDDDRRRWALALLRPAVRAAAARRTGVPHAL